MSDLVLETHDLTKKYGDRRAVDSVTMTVRRGEVYGFLGPNGAGKTTTLRMSLGLVHPTSGSARVLGRPAGDPAAIARVGALVEGPGFYPYLSGRANLQVMARYRGLPDRAVDHVLERVELADRGGDRFKAYSLGMKQRLGVAAALMGDPDLIVLDEPTNGLDPGGMADMRALIMDLARGGQTVLLSSHLLAEVEEICDRVGVISRGRLLEEATVADLRGGRRLRIVATPLDRALAVGMRFTEDAELHDDAVLLDVPAERIPHVVRALVDDGLDVHEAVITERTLEEVFFEMTRRQRETPLEVLS
ncbi:MAG TPA: ABC transporter ATP-binding protein [Nocardioides sp.]|nr:ABC transporter ATP-binding protein [Nocardioides sp.]